MKINLTGQVAGTESLEKHIRKIEKSIDVINSEMKTLHFLLMSMPHLELELCSKDSEGTDYQSIAESKSE